MRLRQRSYHRLTIVFAGTLNNHTNMTEEDGILKLDIQIGTIGFENMPKFDVVVFFITNCYR